MAEKKTVEGKLLKVSLDTHKRLKPFGEWGDTADTVISKLIDMAEGKPSKK